MQPTATIRVACFEDYPGIASLQSRYGLVPKSRAEWRHLWVNNPVYKQFDNWPIGWVLETEKQIVGYLGNIPLSYEFRQRQIVAAASHGMVVDLAYRSYSLSLIRQYYRQPNVGILLSTTANAQASKAYEVFRAEKVPVGNWDQSTFWITQYRGFIASLLRKKRIPLARELSLPLGAAMFLRDRLAGETLRVQRNGVSINNHQHFDTRFDRFWQELKKSSDRRLLATRSRDTLNWHFKYMLAEDRAWITTVERDSRLIAYGIFCRHDNSAMGLKRLRLVDFQTLDNKAELLRPMLAWALERCRANKVHMPRGDRFRS